MSGRAALIALATLLAVPSLAAAQDPVQQMLDLLRARPEQMSHEAWMAQRREAVRELGRMREARAVPVLLQIVARERFDVILELAIDALGKIGDRRAILALQQLLEDSVLDTYVRDAAARALKALGHDRRGPTPEAPAARPSREGPRRGPRAARRPGTDDRAGQKKGSPATRPAGEGRASSQRSSLQGLGELPPLPPVLRKGLLFRHQQWRIAAGSADVHWDGGTETTRARIAALSRFRYQEEHRRLGYSLDATLDLTFQLQRPPGDEASWELLNSVRVRPEVRYYPFDGRAGQVFGQIIAGAGYGLAHVSQPAIAESRLSVAGTLSVGAGPGYGRIINVGPRLRLHRVERLLRGAGLLHGKLKAEVAQKVLDAWYHTHNDLGDLRRLGYTLQALGQASPLLTSGTEVLASDPATTYRLLRILQDPQLDDRPEGVLIRSGIGYARSLILDAWDQNQAFLYATGEYWRQLGFRHAFQASLSFFYQMVGAPDFYGVTLQGGYGHYFYGQMVEPQGALDLGLRIGLSNQPGSAFQSDGLGYRLLLEGAFSRFFSRGSRVVTSLQLGLDTGAPLILLTLEAIYGIESGSACRVE